MWLAANWADSFLILYYNDSKIGNARSSNRLNILNHSKNNQFVSLHVKGEDFNQDIDKSLENIQ